MMDKRIMVKVFVVLLMVVGACWACRCKEDLLYDPPLEEERVAIEAILGRLNQTTKELKSYEGKIEYLFRQPLFDSKTLRKGVLYYEKSGEKSKLRINFKTLKEDDEKERKEKNEYIFDGVWLTRIDYQIKTVEVRQLTEPNKPMDAFELASRNFPIIGFSKIEELEEQFEIKLVEQVEGEASGFIKMGLKVRPGSIYEDNYTSVDFWIDEELCLPAKIITTSTEDEIYEIELVKPKINKGINKNVFEFKIPKGFSKEVIPLKKED